jgi:hypothetical protein
MLETSKKQAASRTYRLLFEPEDRGRTFLRNVGELLPDPTAMHPR